MTIEVRPLGVKCNIQCQYCYQEPQRDARAAQVHYDMGLMKQALEEAGRPFSLFGGEPLLMPKPDLEELWRWGYQKFGRNSVQTNGTLIDDDHVRMFRDYHVQVGVSIDGPGLLNDARWHGSLEQTRASTEKTEAAIARLCSEGVPPSIIVTLNRANASSDRLPALIDWVRELDSSGVRWLRLHLMEADSAQVREKYALMDNENIAALRRFRAAQRELRLLHIDLFDDMRDMLVGKDEKTTCVWHACDSYTTNAVQGIEGHGQRSNCGRTNKDGIDFVKASATGYERTLVLFATPQENGGCQGCRFFLMCKGQCPGTSIDGDWRNRTEHCAVWKALFDDIERDLLDSGELPISTSPQREELEQAMLSSWVHGRQSTLASLLRAKTLNLGAAIPARSHWRVAVQNLRGTN
jgi:uncharacterized protein